MQEHEQLDLIEILVVMQLFRQLLFSGYIIENNMAKFRYKELDYAVDTMPLLQDMKPDFQLFKNRSVLALSQRLQPELIRSQVEKRGNSLCIGNSIM